MIDMDIYKEALDISYLTRLFFFFLQPENRKVLHFLNSSCIPTEWQAMTFLTCCLYNVNNGKANPEVALSLEDIGEELTNFYRLGTPPKKKKKLRMCFVAYKES